MMLRVPPRAVKRHPLGRSGIIAHPPIRSVHKPGSIGDC
jgi:hypothetical protein